MTGTTEADVRGTAGTTAVRTLLLVSAVALAVQTSLTTYSSDTTETRGFWFVVGVGLLLLVHRRRSETARLLVVIPALAGAVLHGFSAWHDPRAAVLALAFLGEALPLMSLRVRTYVRPRPRSRAAAARA